MMILWSYALTACLGVALAAGFYRLGWERLWFISWMIIAAGSVLLLAIFTVGAVLSLFMVGSIPIETVVTLAVIDAAVLWAWKPAVRLYRKQESYFVLRHLSRQQ